MELIPNKSTADGRFSFGVNPGDHSCVVSSLSRFRPLHSALSRSAPMSQPLSAWQVLRPTGSNQWRKCVANYAAKVFVVCNASIRAIGYLPVVLPLLLPGVTVDPWKIARSLVLLMLLPLAIGLALKARYEDFARRVKPVLDWISNVSLILLVLLITAANIDKVLQVFGR